MKITPEWMAETSHCPDGRAFALSTLPAAGLDLDKCWPLLDRADWIVSLAVKTRTISHHEARWIIERTLFIHAQEMNDPETVGIIEKLNGSMLGAYDQMREEAASLAYAALLLGNNLGWAHRLNSIGQLISADIAEFRVGDSDLSLERLQGAAFSLGLSMGQAKAAELIKTRMFNLLKTKKGGEIARV